LEYADARGRLAAGLESESADRISGTARRISLCFGLYAMKKLSCSILWSAPFPELFLPCRLDSASGSLGLGGWILFWILFLLAASAFFCYRVMYEEDYERGGLKCFP